MKFYVIFDLRDHITAVSQPMHAASDNFWFAFCVFHAHFWGKTHSFKICALKKRNDFRQLKEVILEWRSANQRRIYQSS